jgi:hypothetical protein
MTAASEPVLPPALVARLDRAQAEIRALVARGVLTPAERLELAAWQREWVAARREAAAYETAA